MTFQKQGNLVNLTAFLDGRTAEFEALKRTMAAYGAVTFQVERKRGFYKACRDYAGKHSAQVLEDVLTKNSEMIYGLAPGELVEDVLEFLRTGHGTFKGALYLADYLEAKRQEILGQQASIEHQERKAIREARAKAAAEAKGRERAEALDRLGLSDIVARLRKEAAAKT